MSPRVLLLLAATPLFAQFSQFAATDDGSQVYFISPLVLYSSPTSQPAVPRLYRIDANGVSLVAQPAINGNSTGLLPNGGGISNPQVSGDGKIFGYTVQDVCDSNCSPRAVLHVIVDQGLGPGTLQLSRNERWTLVTALFATTGPPPNISFVATLTDRTNNFGTQIPQALSPGPRVLASDGTVLLTNGLWKQGQTAPLPPLPGLSYTPQALSDNAATLIAFAFVPGVQGSIQLVAINLPSDHATILAQANSSSAPVYMAMSNDGTRALYRVTPLASFSGAAYVADTSTGQSTPIALPAGEFVSDGTLSGDGTTAILATTLGRIVKVTLATGDVEPLIPPTPYIAVPGELPIGSLVHLQTSYPGTAADWAGQIVLGGKPLPVLGVQPDEVNVQVPWEQAPGPAQLQINRQDGSPFQQFQPVFVSPIAPAFEPIDPGASAILPIKIVKGDWSGYQTTQPHAGDIVYIYMTGLGPVTGPVQTGVPASLTTLNPIQGTLTCTFTPQTTPAQTLFAGLAPGAIGVYQTTFQIPADPNTKPLTGMNCSLAGEASFGFQILTSGILP
jgi:uncharacterized protein (TIGR03437 family)